MIRYNVEFITLYDKALRTVIEGNPGLFSVNLKLSKNGIDVMNSLCDIKLHEIECDYRSQICNEWQRSQARAAVCLIKSWLKGVDN